MRMSQFHLISFVASKQLHHPCSCSANIALLKRNPLTGRWRAELGRPAMMRSLERIDPPEQDLSIVLDCADAVALLSRTAQSVPSNPFA
jgi:hypothetical protein